MRQSDDAVSVIKLLHRKTHLCWLVRASCSGCLSLFIFYVYVYIYVRRCLYSGGTAVTVSGQRLDLLLNPLLAVYVGNDTFTSVS